MSEAHVVLGISVIFGLLAAGLARLGTDEQQRIDRVTESVSWFICIFLLIWILYAFLLGLYYLFTWLVNL